MHILNLTQGSPEWHAARAAHFCASEAAAAMGVSRHTTRADLLRLKATGVAPEVTADMQRRFDAGHAAEAAARPGAEALAGDELSPLVGTLTVDGLPLLASFDGINLMGDVIWENKLWNTDLATQVANLDLEPHYWAQLEHQLLVSGADRALFTTSAQGITESGALEHGVDNHLWYESVPERRAQVIAAWKAFQRDLLQWQPEPAAPMPAVAAPVQALPAVSVQVSGQIVVQGNFQQFETALRDFLAGRLIREPKTDQDFADLDEQIRALKKAETALDAAEAQMLAQIQSVDEAKRHKDALTKLVRENRLMAEKLLAAEKQRRKEELVMQAREKFSAHMRELYAANPAFRREDILIDVDGPDFAGEIKGLKTIASIQNALDAALLAGQVKADAAARDLAAKLAWLNDNAAGRRALLRDLPALLVKPLEDFQRAVRERIDEHQRAEQARLEAERARIAAEERAKAEAAVRAEQERIRREEDERLRAQEQARQAAEQARIESGNALRQDAPAATLADSVVAGTAPFALTGAARNEEPAAPPPNAAPTLRLGQINERLAPIQLSTEGLIRLGLPPAGTDKAAKLWHERDFPRICAALIACIQNAMAAPTDAKATNLWHTGHADMPPVLPAPRIPFKSGKD